MNPTLLSENNSGSKISTLADLRPAFPPDPMTPHNFRASESLYVYVIPSAECRILHSFVFVFHFVMLHYFLILFLF